MHKIDELPKKIERVNGILYYPAFLTFHYIYCLKNREATQFTKYHIHEPNILQ